LLILKIVLWEILARKTPYKELKTHYAIMRYVTDEKKRPNMKKVPKNTPKKVNKC